MKHSKTKTVAFYAALVVLAVVQIMPIPESISLVDGVSLSPAGKSAIGVLLFALILWMTEAIPFHITGLLAVCLLALLRVAPFTEIVRFGFGSHIAVFMIGVLILSTFVNVSGLGKRITTYLLSRTGDRTRIVVLGFMVIGALLSMWLSNMAVAAMLMPLARSVLRDEGVTPLKSNFGRALMIACAWGPAIGGIGTPAGAGPNPLAIGFLSEMAGIDITFVTWMAFGVPAALLLIVPAWAVLVLVFPPEYERLGRGPDGRGAAGPVGAVRAESAAERSETRPMSREEWITVAVFLLTVVLWLTAPFFERVLSIDIPVSMTVVFTAGLFFLPGVSEIEWSAVEQEINWGSIVLVLAGLSLGMTLHESGAAAWISTLLLGDITSFAPFVAILSVVGIVALLKIIMSSNSVTAAVVVPLMIALAQSGGVGVLGLALPAAVTSSLGLILVTSAPTNVIPYAAGYFSIGDMAKAGTILTIVAVPIVAVVIYAVGQLVGM